MIRLRWNWFFVGVTDYTKTDSTTRFEILRSYLKWFKCNRNLTIKVSWIWHYIVSDSKAPLLKSWWVWSTPLLQLLPAVLLYRVVVSVWFSSMDQIDLFKIYLYLMGQCAKKSLPFKKTCRYGYAIFILLARIMRKPNTLIAYFYYFVKWWHVLMWVLGSNTNPRVLFHSTLSLKAFWSKADLAVSNNTLAMNTTNFLSCFCSVFVIL